MDAGGRATQEAKAEGQGEGGRATQEVKAEGPQYRYPLSISFRVRMP